MATISPGSRRNAWPRQQRQRLQSFLRVLFLVIGATLLAFVYLVQTSASNEAAEDQADQDVASVNESTAADEAVASAQSEAPKVSPEPKKRVVKASTSAPTSAPTLSPTLPPPRILLFHVEKEQHKRGVGHLMHGLLAAQLLGLEFDRTVCVVWSRFFQAFDYAQSEQAELCEHVSPATADVVQWWDYAEESMTYNQRPDECVIQQRLVSTRDPVVMFQGNTYPGGCWRSDIPVDLFHTYYRPKPALLRSLPFSPDDDFPFKLVVHLRVPDFPRAGDAFGSNQKPLLDVGFDDEALYHLGEMLQGNRNYLVTNHVEFIDKFSDCCGWSYDTRWGKDQSLQNSANPEDPFFSESQNLKLWTDWYTLLMADRVYHSNSEFSRSAVHWKGSSAGKSYQMKGMEDNTFKQRTIRLERTSFDPAPPEITRIRKKKAVIPPLVERKRPSNTYMGTHTNCVDYLRFCNRDK